MRNSNVDLLTCDTKVEPRYGMKSMHDLDDTENSRILVNQILDMGMATIPKRSGFYRLLKSEVEDQVDLSGYVSNSGTALIEPFESLSIVARKSISISMEYNEQQVREALLELIMSFRPPKLNH